MTGLAATPGASTPSTITPVVRTAVIDALHVDLIGRRSRLDHVQMAQALRSQLETLRERSLLRRARTVTRTGSGL